MRKTFFVAAALATVFCAAGCMQFKQSILVTPEGAGRMSASFKLNDGVVEKLKSGDNPFLESVLNEALGGEGLENFGELLGLAGEFDDAAFDEAFLDAYEDGCYLTDLAIDAESFAFNAEFYFDDITRFLGGDFGEISPLLEGAGMAFVKKEDGSYGINMSGNPMGGLGDLGDMPEMPSPDDPSNAIMLEMVKAMLGDITDLTFKVEIRGVSAVREVVGFKKNKGRAVFEIDMMRALTDSEYAAQLRAISGYGEMSVLFAKPKKKNQKRARAFKNKLAKVKAEAEEKYERLMREREAAAEKPEKPDPAPEKPAKPDRPDKPEREEF